MTTICRLIREFRRNPVRVKPKTECDYRNLTELAPERSADEPHEPAVGIRPQVSRRATGHGARSVGKWIHRLVRVGAFFYGETAMALPATYEILRDGRHVSSNLYKSFDEILAFIETQPAG